MKCTGAIIAPPGVIVLREKKALKDFSYELFIKIWKAIIARHNDRPQVNLCAKCGDLEIYGKWQKVPSDLKEAVKGGAIRVNGEERTCDKCTNCASIHAVLYGMKE